ncbi:Barstar (barnase inhibitor) [Hydrobacter penzbergensis]|uniref:Barstar (Barnase inhibitor) n=1 Tax=Hydrobacter penzbergensis TaxID=1235997 RepID=A0A8X8LCZ1_9BACT|nr:barstar family protein [Hydrobacter penzbergensis]SDW57899.1 Barstar (barnase inhibitor) [Hydrobacter penzbergensis]
MDNQTKIKLFSQYDLSPTTTYIGLIDGNKSRTLKAFMKEVSVEFKFPDYYSGNMNSFTEIMNDLSWLNADNYILVVDNASAFLQDESLNEQEAIKKILTNITMEWNGVPNYDGEDEYRKRSRFIVHYM